VAGFYAIFVAFVPTGLTETLGILSIEERQRALFGLRCSIFAVVAITVIFVLFEWRFGHWTIPRLLPQRQASKWMFRVTTAVGVAFLVLVYLRGFMDETFAWVHLAAAILLFVSLAAAVASHAWPGPFGGGTDPSENRYRTWYRIIFFLMLAGAPGALVLWAFKFEYTVLLLEGWEMFLFSAFWVFEAKRTWTRVASTPSAAV
jgi:hypothetical protein